MGARVRWMRDLERSGELPRGRPNYSVGRSRGTRLAAYERANRLMASTIVGSGSRTNMGWLEWRATKW